ncbi:MAG: DNA polymerase I [Lachnospiraceae bacterium]|nr:DNA polymerase I [Lachnospiraceae bacterium]
MSKLVLIDGHSILNRAFYGLPDLTNSQGLHTNAVYGFINIMTKFLETEKPEYFAVAFDVHAPTFRHKMFEEYKGTRNPMAPELKIQVPMMKQMLTAMGVPIFEVEGFEADDVLGTLAKRGEAAGLEVTLVSGDRDMLQLASDHIKISIPKTKKTGTEIENYYAADVLEQKQVTPEEFIDVKALMGDTADNIPGVPGIGEKTATAIIAQYHSIENAHEHADEVKPPRASNNLKEYWEQAVMSKTLATIETNAPVELDLDAMKLNDLYTPEAYLLCKEWEFKNLLSRFENTDSKASNDVEEYFASVSTVTEVLDVISKYTKFLQDGDYVGIGLYTEGTTCYGVSLAHGDEAVLCDMVAFAGSDRSTALDSLGKLLTAGGHLVACDVKSILNRYEALFAVEEETAADGQLDLFSLGERSLSSVHTPIRVLPEKYHNYVDVSLGAYLLDPLPSEYPVDMIAKNYLGWMIPSYVDLFTKDKFAKAWENVEGMRRYTCYEAYVVLKAVEPIRKELEKQGMSKLYDEVELPLVFCLYDMERAGISCNRGDLKEYGRSLEGEIARLEKNIYEEAGTEFNINSPKQLGEILFERLGLQGGKKTKTGYSTAADVLEKLAPENPIVSDILSYRQLAKLKSTYADGLDKCIAADGRIHTTFQQTVTATGRLSSTEPNLQNIPIRIEQGKLIRKVFHAKPGYVFLDADYSQIELRVLAHLSGDENLIEAYKQNKDIHRSTAALVFHTPFEEVTELQRRNAKAVNFGIVYGISSFGLGQDLNITRKEAQEYIDNYYAAYPKLKTYIDGLVESAKETGEALTLFGRKRPIPEIHASNFMQRSFGERIAMNSPIQGTAADIIKIAMIRVHDRLVTEGLESQLILQVHDELLIETKESELTRVRAILEEEMRGAAQLLVPLEIDVHEGTNWYDAK